MQLAFSGRLVVALMMRKGKLLTKRYEAQGSLDSMRFGPFGKLLDTVGASV